MVFRLLRMSFWSNWMDRLKNNSERFITPNDEVIIQEVNKIDYKEYEGDLDKAVKAWLHVRDVVEYKLSRVWKPPRRTLIEGTGDCEDYTFLLASMFPNMGIEESELVIGNLYFPSGRIEEHTWNVVDGQIIDATGDPEDVEALEYEAKKSVTLKTVADNGITKQLSNNR